MAALPLADLINYVEADLTDITNLTWSTVELTRALRKALYRYSEVRPQQAIGTLAAAASREYALTTLTGLIDVERVWWPYLSTDPDYPPKWQPFELWSNKGTLYMMSENCPTVADNPLRVYYTKLHAIKDLDTAATSTYPVEDEEVLILGGAAYAAVQRTRYVVDTVNPSVQTPDAWAQWADKRMMDFQRELKRVAARMERYNDSRIPVPYSAGEF